MIIIKQPKKVNNKNNINNNKEVKEKKLIRWYEWGKTQINTLGYKATKALTLYLLFNKVIWPSIQLIIASRTGLNPYTLSLLKTVLYSTFKTVTEECILKQKSNKVIEKVSLNSAIDLTGHILEENTSCGLNRSYYSSFMKEAVTQLKSNNNSYFSSTYKCLFSSLKFGALLDFGRFIKLSNIQGKIADGIARSYKL